VFLAQGFADKLVRRDVTAAYARGRLRVVRYDEGEGREREDAEIGVGSLQIEPLF
jgi:hypothetical protein